MPQWEYKRLCYGWDEERRDLIWEDTREGDVNGDTLDQRLNELGAESWELVSVEKISDVSHVVVNFYLKRPVENPTDDQLRFPETRRAEDRSQVSDCHQE